MRKVLLILPVLTGLVWSCGTTSPLRSKLSPLMIDSLHTYHLPSLVFTISKGNKQEPDPFYSDSSLSIRKKVFENVVVPVVLIPDSGHEKTLSKYLWILMNEVEKKRKIKGVVPGDSILTILEKEKVRYALVTFNSGFSREKGNYGEQLVKGVAVGVVTLGMFVPVPLKANSTSVTYIIDTQNKEIAFYRKKTAELEPLKYKNLNRQYQSLLNSYFNM